MKKYLLVGLVILSMTRVHAQSSDGLTELRALLDTTSLNINTSRLDSTKLKAKQRVDSLNLKGAAVNRKLDSLRGGVDRVHIAINNSTRKAEEGLNKVNQLDDKLIHAMDTLDPQHLKYVHRLDSVKSRLTSSIDSLSGLGLPYDKYTRALDSIKQRNPINKVRQTQQTVSDTQSGIQKKLEMPTDKINEKLGVLSREAEGQGDLPSNVNLPKGQQTDVSKIVSKDLNMPSAPKIDNPIGENSNRLKEGIDKNLEMKLSSIVGKDIKESVKEKVNGDLIDLHPKTELSQLKSSEELEKIRDGTSEISETENKIVGYSSDVKNIKEGNLDRVSTMKDDVASKIKIDELNDAQKQLGAASEQQQKLAALRNQEAFKKQTLAKGREMVMAQMATQHVQLAETINKVSMHQRKLGTLFSKVKNLPNRPVKEKKPPFIERFVPGLTTQVQKNNLWLIDINPALRFRAKSILSIGLGWNERVAVDKNGKYQSDKRIYGLRSFSELTIKKGLSVRVDVERMNAFVPMSHQQLDVGERKWVWSYMAGLRKDFSFAPGVLGNVQFMYNLYDPKNQSPYLSRFNVRFGFEIPFKVKTHRKSTHD